MYLLDLVKVLSLAAVLTRVSKNEPRSSLVALAWALRNRAKIDRDASKFLTPDNYHSFCYEAISSAGSVKAGRRWNTLTILKDGLNEGYCKSLAIASLVWCGEEADPTDGATHFHRHDDWPEWAKNSQPVALIGSWFFYNEINEKKQS